MSKELIERLCGSPKDTAVGRLDHEAAERIEELERELEAERQRRWDGNRESSEELRALYADNERLREVMRPLVLHRHTTNDSEYRAAEKALAATPAQSLARIRNHVREECAAICMGLCSVIEEPHEFERCRDAIRSMKEPE